MAKQRKSKARDYNTEMWRRIMNITTLPNKWQDLKAQVLTLT